MLSFDLSHLGRLAMVVAGAATLVSTAACRDGATAPRSASLPTSAAVAASTGPSALYDAPPTIDGVMDPGEWDTAEQVQFPVWIPGDMPFPSSSATAYVGRDASYLYLALVFDRKSPFRSNDYVSFEFDNDNDGIAETGDDVVGINANSQSAWDHHRFKSGMLITSDESRGGVNNAIGRFKTSGQTGVIEIRKEIDSVDNAHDFSINTDFMYVTLGMRAMVALEGGQPGSGLYARSWKPNKDTYCRLNVGKRQVDLWC